MPGSCPDRATADPMTTVLADIAGQHPEQCIKRPCHPFDPAPDQLFTCT
jgi:hypothetical protein